MSARVVLAVFVAFVSLAAPRAASARPAVVRVFEAEARARPEPDAPIVHRFAERAEVSVSEASQGGWWRVRLPDGRTGWIEDAAIALGEPAVAPPPATAPAPPPATQPDLHAHVFVEDAGQLPRLMGSDPAFGEQAESLASRRKAAFIGGGLGLATSIALFFAGASAMNSQNPGDPNFNASAGSGLMLAGMVTFAVGAAVAILVYPHRSEVVDLVNGWNLAHPDRQLTVPQPAIVVPGGGDPWSGGAVDAPAPSTSERTGPVLVIPATGGPPELAIPNGAGTYLPVTGGPPVPGTPVGP